MSAIVTSVVMTASRTDRASDEVNPGSLITEPKALIPANRSAAHSGSRKYTAATMRIVQRQAVLCQPGGTTPRNPPRLGGPIPPGPPCRLLGMSVLRVMGTETEYGISLPGQAGAN